MNKNQGSNDIKDNKQNLNSNTSKSTPQGAPGADRDLGQRKGDSSTNVNSGSDKKRADWEGMGQQQSDKNKTPSKY
jgi:hypothetical protein